MTDDDAGEDDAAVTEVTEVPLTDELDLHHFLPREVADLVTEYVHAAHAAGMRRVRIIHGKGTGALRRTVHAALERHPLVAGFRLGDQASGTWGATLVELRDDPVGPVSASGSSP
jgi:dsDNA-specific endonuclease/ATPase MutS2